MTDPFEASCVVVSQTASCAGICFKISPKSEFGCLYNLLLWCRYNEQGELKIAFTHHILTITGQRLQPLVEVLTQQRISSMRVVTRAELPGLLEGDQPIVESIKVEENVYGAEAGRAFTREAGYERPGRR